MYTFLPGTPTVTRPTLAGTEAPQSELDKQSSS